MRKLEYRPESSLGFTSDLSAEVIHATPTDLVIPELPPRKVLAAVRADLAALGDLTGGARGSLAAIALYLAEVIDTRGAGAPPAASARLAQELRATMVALTMERTDDHDRLDQFLDEMGTPADLSPEVGHAADAKPADARAKGRRNRQGPR